MSRSAVLGEHLARADRLLLVSLPASPSSKRLVIRRIGNLFTAEFAENKRLFTASRGATRGVTAGACGGVAGWREASSAQELTERTGEKKPRGGAAFWTSLYAWVLQVKLRKVVGLIRRKSGALRR